MSSPKIPNSGPIDRGLRRRKRKVVNDTYSAMIKLSAALQDLRDSTAEMKEAYRIVGDAESEAECDRILRWLPPEVDLDPRVNKRSVRSMLSTFTKLPED